MPLLSISSKDTIRNCASLLLRASDVFICSYPKSGTTWTQHIVLSLLLQHKRNTVHESVLDYQHVSEFAPFFEIDAHWEGNDFAADLQHRHDLLGTRVFNTHLRFDMLPNGHGARLIYIVRSPLDTCVSFYHHLSHQVEGGYEGTFDDFYREWLAGDIAFGAWMDHVLSFAVGFSSGQAVITMSNQVHLSDGRKMLLVSYEDMISNLPQVVHSIQDFLELDTITLQQRQDMLPSFEFASMKQTLEKFQPQSVEWKGNFSFLRKGVSGDSLTMITEQQHKEFEECMERKRFRKILVQLLRDSHPQVYSTMESLVS